MRNLEAMSASHASQDSSHDCTPHTLILSESFMRIYQNKMANKQTSKRTERKNTPGNKSEGGVLL